jgi:hypothetical protein
LKRTPPFTLTESKASILPVAVGEARITGYEEDPKLDEPLGDHKYTFDNSRSRSTAVETIRLVQRAAVSVIVDVNKLKTTSGEAGLSFTGLFTAQGKIVNELHRRYALTNENELTFEQSTAISIPARAHVQVIVHWKRVWQPGKVRLNAQGHDLSAPYFITIGLRFDKETVDIEQSR